MKGVVWLVVHKESGLPYGGEWEWTERAARQCVVALRSDADDFTVVRAELSPKAKRKKGRKRP